MKYNDNTPEYTRLLYLFNRKRPLAILRAFRKQCRDEVVRD